MKRGHEPDVAARPQEQLGSLRTLELEEQDRRGYQALPPRSEEYLPLEEIASWPED